MLFRFDRDRKPGPAGRGLVTLFQHALRDVEEGRDRDRVGDVRDETTDQRHDEVCQLGVVILLADGGHGRHGDRDSAQAESGVADAAGDDEEEPCLLALRGKSLPVQV